MAKKSVNPPLSRRDFFKHALRILTGAAAAGVAGKAAFGSASGGSLWQIDPAVCVACGRCMDNCVLNPSAVKCVHAYAVCGYCDLCSGYFKPNTQILETGAEGRLCPTGAIKRTFIEDPYYEYVIEEDLCIACGLCIKGCEAFGNGSLFLQIRHDRCVNCNQCSIARQCPSGAVRRVPASQPYLLKGIQRAPETSAETDG